ncbi:MAG: GAF domain-containing protein [Candidatus Rokubacteria bacterium]|nr:GAF domain-containing protein [Candidatus Rokubacteria bacterium]
MLFVLSGFVWRARPDSRVNRWFALQTIVLALWVVGVGGIYESSYRGIAARLAFASASLIPATVLTFARLYPTSSTWPSATYFRLLAGIGAAFSVLSLFTPLVTSNATSADGEIVFRRGPLYRAFAAYFLTTWCLALIVFFGKWRAAKGQARLQLQYLGLGIFIAGAGGITTNLLIPLWTGRSTYSWIGPYFAVTFVLLVAHAIIRHRLMDLRFVVRRGITIAIATTLSLLPAALLAVLSWPRLSDQFTKRELTTMVIAVIVVTLLAPPIRDLSARLLDRYVYRTHANFIKTMRQASAALTRILNLDLLLSFIGGVVVTTTASEGAAVYLRREPDRKEPELVRGVVEQGSGGTRIASPDVAPPRMLEALIRTRDLIVTDELEREPEGTPARVLHQDLVALNWGLVLPLLSENHVIGAIVVGPKRSGDAFYPHDLDLLMSLANQAGIAVKNAQLYGQVVLANEYLQNIAATIESGVVAIDPGGRICMFNRAAEHLTALVAGAVLEQDVGVLPEVLAEALKGTVADGVERVQPEIDLPAGASARPVICTTSPLRSPDGAILGAVAVFSDLTPLKELELERRRAERLAYFQMLASVMGHEIKNPLVAIKTFAQLLPRRQGDAQFVDEFGRIVGREIHRMERLLNGLRTLARPSDRPRQIVDLRLPMAEALETLQPGLDEKRIAVFLVPDPSPCLVLGDHHELEQLFLNLLGNAKDATPPEGTLSVRVTAAGDHVTASVADSGPGVPPALLERIFDPFFTTKKEGSGLGLAICTNIAAAHRARLRVVNREGGGAEFTVDFPLTTTVAQPVAGPVVAG